MRIPQRLVAKIVSLYEGEGISLDTCNAQNGQVYTECMLLGPELHDFTAKNIKCTKCWVIQEVWPSPKKWQFFSKLRATNTYSQQQSINARPATHIFADSAEFYCPRSTLDVFRQYDTRTKTVFKVSMIHFKTRLHISTLVTSS